ncbi:hypothetical protein HDU80_007017 [Chytriomyces hyalinus]|nr:hypothetical protein HDU80_007017 [Chytriomyces hyalinus]
MESTNYNAAELAQTCNSASLQTSPIPTIPTIPTSSTNSNPTVISLPNVQQQSSAPIIGGTVGAGVLVCIAVAICVWLRRKRDKSQLAAETNNIQSNVGGNVETVNTFPSSIQLPSDHLLGSVKKAAVSASFDNFLVASQVSPPPEKDPLFDHLKTQPYDQNPTQHQDRKVDTIASSKSAMPEHKALFAQKFEPVVHEKDLPFNEVSESQASAPSHAYVDSAPASESHGSSSHRIALPEDPNDWTEDEVAQWILERFNDAELSSLALSKTASSEFTCESDRIQTGQKVNGRVLLLLDRQELKSELGLEILGKRRLFEEAVSELRRKSAQQSALAQESPPSYE